MVGEVIAKNIEAWLGDVRNDAHRLAETVIHRVSFGSPPLLDPAEDAAVSPRLTLDAHQKRIRRRRLLLGLPYEEWKGIGGK